MLDASNFFCYIDVFTDNKLTQFRNYGTQIIINPFNQEKKNYSNLIIM